MFGDRQRRRSPAEQIQILRAALDAIAACAPGIERHAALVSVLLSAGELVQGLADAAFDTQGCDRQDPASGAAMRVTVALGRAVWRSHGIGYAATPADLGDVAASLNEVERLAGAALEQAVTVRSAEGFQHYAVYPEAYALAAAAAFPGRAAPLVVGIRTIGATLAAAVAGAASDPGLPLTVRPIGHPFERRLSLGDDVAQVLAAARGRPVAVVDEGPGLSGSSFGAVLDALEAAGVPESDARIFPSHGGGLGAAATPRNEARWQRVRRLYVPFEEAFLNASPEGPGLAAWLRDLTGPLDEPPEDVGAGGWRRLHWPEPRWPPAIAMRERRKYLLRAGGQRFLARFAGLGEAGQAAAARAQALGEAGLSPPVLGIRHGFLLTRWVEGARPLWPARGGLPGAELIARVGAYLAFRADSFATDVGRGAAPDALLEMTVLNAAEGGCPDAARAIERFADWTPALARAARPIAVDARLHAWEWLLLPDGRLWKTDAADHCDAHDPIGCQDLAWDVAGAAIELELDAGERAALARALAARGHPVDPQPLQFYTAAYLAFQLALHATGAAAAGEPGEAARLATATDRYRRLLGSVL
ncbi:MAG TPA: hypothetical protein VHO67_04900 [Polyangia bacterium]|nr:hypothetical protein [Polyangia bacterium]